MKIGVNTYGLAKLLNEDFEGTLANLKKTGITTIEPCILFEDGFGPMKERMMAGLKQAHVDMSFWLFADTTAKIKKVKEMGLEVVGAHISLVQFVPGGIEALLPQLIQLAKECGLKYYVYCPMNGSVEEMKKIIPSVQKAVKVLGENGISLLFHNHSVEFTDNNGDCVFDLLMREVPGLLLEPDVGWVEFAGHDSVALLECYRKAVKIVHFKDFNKGATDETIRTNFAAIGEGAIPLNDILEESQKLDLFDTGYILDQDSSQGDMLEDIKKGFFNLNSWFQKDKSL